MAEPGGVDEVLVSGKSERLVWIEIATSDDDPDRAALLEIAMAVTDNRLQVVAEAPEVVLEVSAATLAAMPDAVRRRHEATGLSARLAQGGVPLAEAEGQLLEFLSEHCDPQSAPVCGYEVWRSRAIVRRHLSNVVDYLHYRLVDVATIEALALLWYPDESLTPLRVRREREHMRAQEALSTARTELQTLRAHVMVGEPPAE